jgi:hypothetical protein
LGGGLLTWTYGVSYPPILTLSERGPVPLQVMGTLAYTKLAVLYLGELLRSSSIVPAYQVCLFLTRASWQQEVGTIY